MTGDVEACARISHAAFADIAGRHAFPPDFPTPEPAIELIGWMMGRDDVYSVVAEVDGRIAGSNFMWETAPVVGVGPITVDPRVQDAGIGRRLMEHVLARAQSRRHAGVRLVQAGYHGRSLALYAKLGFDVREPLACMQGAALGLSIPGYEVRPAAEEDLDACAMLHRRLHGFERRLDLLDGIGEGKAMVVEHGGRITGYTTGIGFFGHAVAEGDEGLKALIGAAPAFADPGLLLPTRNAELFRWCLGHGLRFVQPMTLMSVGLYNEPAGAFLPSVLY
jgi:GNAT superfamily N-acetyltransferase